MRPEKNTKYARGTNTFKPEKENYQIHAEFGIRWGVLEQFLNRVACKLRMDYAPHAPYPSPNTPNPSHVIKFFIAAQFRSTNVQIGIHLYRKYNTTTSSSS